MSQPSGSIGMNGVDPTSLAAMQQAAMVPQTGGGLFGLSTGSEDLLLANPGISQDSFNQSDILQQGGTGAGFSFGLGLGLGMGLGMGMGMNGMGGNTGMGVMGGMPSTLPNSLQDLVGMVPSSTLQLMTSINNMMSTVLADINTFVMQLMQSEAQRKQEEAFKQQQQQQTSQTTTGSQSTGSANTSASTSTGGTNDAKLTKDWQIPIGKDFKSQADVDAFKAKVVQISQNMGTDPDNLMAIMNFESGFSSSVTNHAGSGATGLIQFMPDTARGLGTSTDALAQMSPVDQLDYVAKYFEGDPLPRLEDLYLRVFYPAAIGKPLDEVIFSSGETGYSQNSGLDANGDGSITVGEIPARVRQIYNETPDLPA